MIQGDFAHTSKVIFTYSGQDNTFDIAHLDIAMPFGTLQATGQIALDYTAQSGLNAISAGPCHRPAFGARIGRVGDSAFADKRYHKGRVRCESPPF